jgi:hypothetical protein
MTLAELIAVRQEAIVRRFTTRAATGPGTPAVSRTLLIDAVPSFLRQLVIGLRQAEGESPVSGHEEVPAREHDRQRFELGFDLSAVVEEYGALFEVILAVASEERVSLTNPEVGELARAYRLAIGQAVREYLAHAGAERLAPAPRRA